MQSLEAELDTSDSDNSDSAFSLSDGASDDGEDTEDSETEATDTEGSASGGIEEQFLLEAADTDTSDEEEIRNTVGNIPMEWYDELAHLGYDIDGKKILKPLSAGGDEVSTGDN